MGHGHEERDKWWDERNLHIQWHLYLGKKEGYLIPTSDFEAKKIKTYRNMKWKENINNFH